jgi:hypothetical protein
MTGQPDQPHPRQWRRGQVQTLRAVALEQLRKLDRSLLLVELGPVQTGHRQRDLAAHDLERCIEAFPRDLRAQHRRPIHHLLPRTAKQTRVLDALQHERHLLEVNPLSRLRQAVEQHPRLHRRQRIDILDQPAVPHQTVHSGLIKASQWIVGRGSAARTGLPAVPDDLPQGGRQLVGEPPYCRLVVHGVRVEPPDRKAPVLDGADHVEQVRPTGVVGGGGVEPAEHVAEQPPLAGPVELAEVVEADLWFHTVHTGLGQVPQRAEAKPSAGNRA